MNAKPKRSDRVSEALRVELSALLARGVIRDPGVRDVIVTGVRVSDDLRHARVYVRQLTDEQNAPQQEQLLSALRRASSFIRRELSPTLKLKYQPDLNFFWDDGLDRAARIEELLRDIKAEDEGRP